MRAPPIPFHTDRLTLRRPTSEDLDGVFAYKSDSEVTRYLTFAPSHDLDDSRAFLVHCDDVWRDGSSYPLVIALRNVGEMVGMIELQPGDHGVELGYVLLRNAWGNGYMVEAVVATSDWALSLPSVVRVSGTCDIDNIASQRVLERAGFEQEGTLHRYLNLPNASDEPRDATVHARWR